MNWFQRLRDQYSAKEYRRGYDFVAGELLRGEITFEKVLDIVDGARFYGTFNVFDRGAEDAALAYQKLLGES